MSEHAAATVNAVDHMTERIADLEATNAKLLAALEEWNAIWCGLAERGGPASPGARTWLIAVGEQAWNKAREAIKEAKGE